MSDAWMSETPNELHARLRRYEDVSCRQQNEIAALTARAEQAERDAEGSKVAYEYAVARAETAEREVERLRAALDDIVRREGHPWMYQRIAREALAHEQG